MWSVSVTLDMGQWPSMQYWWNVDIFEVTEYRGLANLNVNINLEIFVSWRSAVELNNVNLQELAGD